MALTTPHQAQVRMTNGFALRDRCALGTTAWNACVVIEARLTHSCRHLSAMVDCTARYAAYSVP